MRLFVWGFCGPVFNIVKNMENNHAIDTFTVSDDDKTDLNIHDLFFRKIPQQTPDHELRKKLEPHFETFKELYSRHWYPRKISNEEYFSYFNTYIDFFSNLYKKEDFRGAIFSNVPHEGPDYIAFLTAKELNVKTLIFYQTIFCNRVFASEEINLYNPQLIPHSNRPVRDLSKHQEAVDKAISEIGNWFYMSNKPQSEHFTPWQLLKNSRKCFKKDPRLIMQLMYNDAQYYLDYKRSVAKNFSVDNMKFVYFPLHLQPELTTSILGNGFTDQIKAIRYLSDNLPEGVKIVVKENPKQNSFKRPTGYLKDLVSIPRVVLAPVNYPTIDLVKKCDAVTTINGTVGWEAINLGKTVFYFGICWYRELPNVYKYTELNRFSQIVDSTLDKEELFNNVSNFLYENTLEGTVDYDYCKMNPEFDYKKNADQLANYIVQQYLPPFTDDRHLSV